MSSNRPPPISPNTNPNTDGTHDDNTAPSVPVVTQASQSSEEFDPVSTPQQQRIRHIHTEDLMDFQLEHLLEHANTESTPIMAPSTVPRFPTPTNRSPDTSRKRIHSVMDSTTIYNKDRAAAAHSMVSLANSTGKKRCNPKDNLLTFLRSNGITNHASLLETAGKPTMNPNSTLQLARRSWFNSSELKTKDVKLDKFRTKMDVLCERGLLPSALTIFHNRLLLEDIMGVKPDTELVLLIHQSHGYVSGPKDTWWSRRIKTIGDDYAPERLNYIIFQSNLYWALKVTVVSNPKTDSLHDKVYTNQDIVQGCTQHGAWGLRVQVGTGEQQNILFRDILMDPIRLQLWVEGCHTNFGRFNAKMRQLTSNITLTATTKRLLEESYGDSILCQDICNRYSCEIEKRIAKAKSSVINSAVISSSKIKHHYSLPSKHTPFVRFRDDVNEKCRKAIMDTYGKFNTITDPILTYTQVRIHTLATIALLNLQPFPNKSFLD